MVRADSGRSDEPGPTQYDTGSHGVRGTEELYNIDLNTHIIKLLSLLSFLLEKIMNS